MPYIRQNPVYENINPNSRDLVPFLLVVQSPFLDELSTRVTVPLYNQKKAPGPLIERLHMIIEIDGVGYVAVFNHLAAVPKKNLGKLRVTIENMHTEITAALDFLFHGY